MLRQDNAPLSLAEIAEDESPACAAQLKALFKRLCLPIPDEEQFLERRHGNMLIPITTAGCMLQLSARPLAPVTDHPNILQPLGECQEGRWHARLFPGVHLRATDEEAQSLRKQLHAQNLAFHDPYCDNLGHLPIASPQFPSGIPVIIDHDAVTPLSSFTPPAHNPQTQLYASIRAAFAAAQNMPAPQQQARAMRQFWQDCAQQCHSPGQPESGPLTAGWHHASKDFGETTKTATVKKIADNYRATTIAYWRRYDLHASKAQTPQPTQR